MGGLELGRPAARGMLGAMRVGEHRLGVDVPLLLNNDIYRRVTSGARVVGLRRSPLRRLALHVASNAARFDVQVLANGVRSERAPVAGVCFWVQRGAKMPVARCNKNTVLLLVCLHGMAVRIRRQQ